MNNPLKKLGSDSLSYGVLDAANRFIGVFLVPVYTHALATAEYGTLDLVTTLMTVIYGAAYLGMDSALIYYHNHFGDEGKKKQIATTGMFIWAGAVTLTSLMIILLRRQIATLALPGVDYGSGFILLAAIGLPLQSFTHIQTLLLRIRFKLRQYAALSIGLLLTTVILNIVFVLWLKMGVIGVLWAQIIARLVFLLIGFIVTRVEFSPFLSRVDILPMIRYGAPVIVPNLAYWAALYLERYALLLLTALSDVGIYGLAARIASVATLVSNAVDIAWMPFAVSIQKDENAPRIYARALMYYFLFSSLAGMAITIFAREILLLLTTPEYYSAYYFVGPIVASLVFRGGINIVAIGAFLQKRTGILASSSTISTILDAAFLFVLIPLVGPIGAALATLLARIINFILIYLMTRKNYPVPYAWGKMIWMFFLVVVFSGLGLYCSTLQPWPGFLYKLFLVVPLCLVSLYLFHVVSKEEILTLAGLGKPVIVKIFRREKI